MKLWELRPIKDWEPWYDKAFGFVVRAEGEAAARELVVESGETGNEGSDKWLDPTETTCVELKADGEAEVIIKDFARA